MCVCVRGGGRACFFFPRVRVDEKVSSFFLSSRRGNGAPAPPTGTRTMVPAVFFFIYWPHLSRVPTPCQRPAPNTAPATPPTSITSLFFFLFPSFPFPPSPNPPIVSHQAERPARSLPPKQPAARRLEHHWAATQPGAPPFNFLSGARARAPCLLASISHNMQTKCREAQGGRVRARWA